MKIISIPNDLFWFPVFGILVSAHQVETVRESNLWLKQATSPMH